jgi:hypothetical protein
VRPPTGRALLVGGERGDGPRVARVQRERAAREHGGRVEHGPARARRPPAQQHERRLAPRLGAARVAPVGGLELGQRPPEPLGVGERVARLQDPPPALDGGERRVSRVTAASRVRSAGASATSSASATSAASAPCTANASAGATTVGSPAQRVVPSLTRTSTGLTCTRGCPSAPRAQRSVARST